jgi:hypothetical protein
VYVLIVHAQTHTHTHTHTHTQPHAHTHAHARTHSQVPCASPPPATVAARRAENSYIRFMLLFLAGIHSRTDYCEFVAVLRDLLRGAAGLLYIASHRLPRRRPARACAARASWRRPWRRASQGLGQQRDRRDFARVALRAHQPRIPVRRLALRRWLAALRRCDATARAGRRRWRARPSRLRGLRTGARIGTDAGCAACAACGRAAATGT